VRIRPGDFEFVCQLVRQRSAIVIEPGKEYLAEARLEPVARSQGLASLDALIDQLRGRPYADLHQKAVEAMTTNETYFFRDQAPFEVLRDQVLPGLIPRRLAARSLVLWSAACSSGQEPYSLAMMLRHFFPILNPWSITIIASDLSAEMLNRAREADYSQLEINRGLPAPMLVKYFAQHGTTWQLKPELRRMVQFMRMNLVESWPMIPPADVVFLRNVLIYFDVPTKTEILRRVRQVLRPDGALFLGTAETTINLDPAFEPVRVGKTCYFRLRAA
jgi:chemotaxis protein methyltransferase CheR